MIDYDIDNLDIESLTKEDILSADLVECIYEHFDTVPERQDYLNKVAVRAKDLRVSTLFQKSIAAMDRHLNDLKKEQKALAIQTRKQELSVHEYAFNVGNESRVYQTGKWVVGADGVYTETFEGGIITACHYPIIITQRLTNKDTSKERVQITWKKEGRVRAQVVPRGVVASASKIVALADCGVPVTSETAKALVNYFDDLEQLNGDIIPETVSTSKYGWYGDKFVPYCRADIQFDGNSSFGSLVDSIKARGSYEDWLAMVKKIRAEGRIEPMVYLAASFASVLPSRLNALPFLVNLYGETGKGKTVSLMVAASIWANPEGRGYIAESNSTLNALEMRLDVLNNLPLMIDDLAKIQREDSRRLTEMVYTLAAGGGKNRMNRDLEMRYTPSWCNIILTNMERPLTDDTMQGGAVNRVLDFEMQDGYIFKDAPTVVNTVSKNYGWAGKRFTDAVAEIGTDGLREMVETFESAIRAKAKELGDEKEQKQIIPLAILLTADEISEKQIFQDGKRLDFEYCVRTLKSTKEISEMQRAYNYFCDSIAIHQSNFAINDFGENWGKIDYADNKVSIIPAKLNDIARNGNFAAKQFIKWCYSKGLLEPQNEHVLTKSVRVNDVVRRCYVIKMQDDFGVKADNEEDFVKAPEGEELPFDLPD